MSAVEVQARHGIAGFWVGGLFLDILGTTSLIDLHQDR